MEIRSNGRKSLDITINIVISEIELIVKLELANEVVCGVVTDGNVVADGITDERTGQKRRGVLERVTHSGGGDIGLFIMMSFYYLTTVFLPLMI